MMLRTVGNVALLLIATLLNSQAAWAQRTIPDYLKPVVADLDKIATEAVADPENGSYTVALVDKSGVLWMKSYGYADVARKIPATPKTVYRIYSITKTFTALMLLQLVHDGKVHFSDPAESYFPAFGRIKQPNPHSPPITLIQLATHTSGLPIGPKEYDTGTISGWEQQLTRALEKTSFETEPGTHFGYSNLGYGVLGASLAHAAHVEYPRYVRDRILRPLGMDHSGFEQPTDTTQLAVGYELKDNKLDSSVPDALNKNGLGYKVPSGSLFTNGEDLAKFLTFLMGGGPADVLPVKDIEANFDRIVVGNGGDLQTGFGIGFQAFTPVYWPSGALATFLGHTGGNVGYTNAIMFEPHVKIGLLVLHNDGRDNRGFGALLGSFVHTLDISKMPKSDSSAAPGL